MNFSRLANISCLLCFECVDCACVSDFCGYQAECGGLDDSERFCSFSVIVFPLWTAMKGSGSSQAQCAIFGVVSIP